MNPKDLKVGDTFYIYPDMCEKYKFYPNDEWAYLSHNHIHYHLIPLYKSNDYIEVEVVDIVTEQEYKDYLIKQVLNKALEWEYNIC